MQGARSEAPRLLVTGASGFLGGHVAALATRGWQVYGTWHSQAFHLPGVRAVRLDLCDPQALRRTLDEVMPHIIVHCAALTDLDYCETHAEEAQVVNVRAAQLLAQWCGDRGLRFVFVSSDMVFDGSKGHYAESDPVNPINVYGATKVEGEEVVRAHCANYVIARSALIYGRPRTGGSSFSTWIEQRLAAAQPVPLFTDQFRTPILVSELAAALLELCAHSWVGVVHLAGPERVDRFTFGVQLARLLRFEESLLQMRAMAHHHQVAPRPRDVSLRTELARTLLSTPFHGVERGLQLMITEGGPVQALEEGRTDPTPTA
ncbi:MAG: SDR family oxidoreductase [candidate division KSB1 bacterium]|nr:SDR family oxidoreductase [candidate division KSB1 bacterium]